MKKKLICIVGKTGVGKDTFANFIHQKTNIPIVCSYTTRDMREGETNGVQHYYITPEEMQELLKAEDVIAYAKKESGVEYAATYHSLADESIYIVDPTGIYYLREHYSDKIDLYVINLICPEDTVEKRIKSRGDDWNRFLERRENEREEFDSFNLWDICITTTLDEESMYNLFYSDYYLL